MADANTPRRAALSLPALCLLGAGCAYQGQPEPGPAIDEPVDAFEAVGAPHRSGGAPGTDRENLSTDIRRLQDARTVYRREQKRRRAEALRRQDECRGQPDSRKVAIQDGSGDPQAVYCESADDTKPADIQKQ